MEDVLKTACDRYVALIRIVRKVDDAVRDLYEAQDVLSSLKVDFPDGKGLR